MKFSSEDKGIITIEMKKSDTSKKSGNILALQVAIA